MNSKEFIKVFDEVAKANGFEKSFGGWFLESPESIVVLDLQRSDYSDCYMLNIKIYVQGIFDNSYTKNKNLVKKDIGHIFRRQPAEFKEVLCLNAQIDDIERQK